MLGMNAGTAPADSSMPAGSLLPGPSNRACYFGCLKEVSKSVQVLLNGIEDWISSYGIDFDSSEIASPVQCRP